MPDGSRFFGGVVDDNPERTRKTGFIEIDDLGSGHVGKKGGGIWDLDSITGKIGFNGIW